MCLLEGGEPGAVSASKERKKGTPPCLSRDVEREAGVLSEGNDLRTLVLREGEPLSLTSTKPERIDFSQNN